MDFYMIPVAFGVDRAYILQAHVVMLSILKNSKENFVFYIMTADNLQDDINSLTNEMNEYRERYTIKTIKIQEDIFEDAVINCKHLSKASYNRLLLAKYITEWDKCIYLDCDLLVNGDLKELYEKKIGDNYITGVLDCHIIEDSERNKIHEKCVGLASRDTYVNAGVLILNLKRIRQDNLTSKFMEQVFKENWYEDQDVLNKCCYGKVGIIPLKYNLFHFYQGKTIKLLKHLKYTEEDFDFDSDRPFVLHMGGVYKPWNSKNYKGANTWWKLAEAFKQNPLYDEWAKKCEDNMANMDIRYLINKCRNYNKVIIWGFTNNGKQICDALMNNGLGNICSFCDNDSRHSNQFYRNIPVKQFNEVSTTSEEILWIISCQKSFDDVKQQLENYGVNRQCIEHYKHKGAMYYRVLSPDKYYSEIEQMVISEYGEENLNEKVIEMDEKLKRYDKNTVDLFNNRYRLTDWLYA
ncbi:glycosyltransferase family 8 protein [Anaerocolumna xylanovorans]|nr:glycosyltransferase family 8 protein [Anaerocolumna xylanovorans]